MRRTIREIEVNVAYRWFIGYSLTEPVPHFSTFGKNYVRRFAATDIFERILEEAEKAGYVDASAVFIDSTYIKDSAVLTLKKFYNIMTSKISKGAADMSNTSNEKATKGSKFWMQKIVNDDLLRARLEEMLCEKSLRWYSPLQAESYKEYQLKEPKIFSEVLGLSREEFKKFFSFWPTNQPHWDAIAVSADGTLYLFEAKAHIKELNSKTGATNIDSLEKIFNSMRIAFAELSEGSAADFANWTEKYYQLGNRLTFLHFMNRMTLPKIFRTVLVLLNITDDETYIPTPKEIWISHYEKVFHEMFGKKFPPENIRVIYFSGK